jgi:heme/copper-type cytochrome/quinol oxidase subunit 3
MEIPYAVTARPDTGLYNAKVGIWLFLASEVMLFGGLFAGYVFLRLGSEPGHWPHGLLNVPVGTMNTFILIGSSVTVVFAWAALKMRRFSQYRFFMGLTIACGVVFLIVKLCVEWPQKFTHFGAYIKPDALEKYEQYLGNHRLNELKREPRVEITGHLEEAEVSIENQVHKWEVHSAGHLTDEINHEIEGLRAERLKEELAKKKTELGHDLSSKDRENVETSVAKWVPQTKIVAFRMKLDTISADPDNPHNDRPAFLPRPLSDKEAVIHGEDVSFWSAFAPKHSSYFAVYFTITGLHGLHVLGGVIVFIYFMLPVSTRIYQRNPEHLTNRVEVAGLFWHFVDLVWIFVFPIFYLL